MKDYQFTISLLVSIIILIVGLHAQVHELVIIAVLLIHATIYIKLFYTSKSESQ